MVWLFNIDNAVFITGICWITYIFLISLERDEDINYHLTLPGDKKEKIFLLIASQLIYIVPTLTIINVYYHYISFDKHFNPNRFVFNLYILLIGMILNTMK